MKQVTQDEFYKAMGPQNVHPRIVTRWPYTSEWRLLDRIGQPIIGKTVIRDNGGLSVTDYFLVTP